MAAESKKFKVGDKVIAVKDTPQVPEGFIGYIVENGSTFGYAVRGEHSVATEYFEEHELELLSVSKSVRLEGVVHSVEIKGMLEPEHKSALDKQVSGNHYKDCGIQPIEYIHANGLSYLEGNVIKYTTRHSKKNGKQDILKAIHYLELILEMEYKDETK